MNTNEVERFTPKQETCLEQITQMMSRLSECEQERIYFMVKGFELANLQGAIKQVS